MVIVVGDGILDKERDCHRFFPVAAGGYVKGAGKGPCVPLVAVEAGIQRNFENGGFFSPQLSHAVGEPDLFDVFQRRVAEKFPKDPLFISSTPLLV